MQPRTDDPDLTDLTWLLHRLVAARRALDDARRRPPSHHSDASRERRHELVDALEAYTSGLAACNSPIPYRIRDELRLNRALDRTR